MTFHRYDYPRYLPPRLLIGSPGYVEIVEQPPALADLRQVMCDAKAAPLMSFMVAFPQALQEIPFDAVAVVNSRKIQWLARNSSKPGLGSRQTLTIPRLQIEMSHVMQRKATTDLPATASHQVATWDVGFGAMSTRSSA